MSIDVWFYVIHEGTGTYLALDECDVVGIRNENKEALSAIEDEDFDKVYEVVDYKITGAALVDLLKPQVKPTDLSPILPSGKLRGWAGGNE